jgi:hypothetical protein
MIITAEARRTLRTNFLFCFFERKNQNKRSAYSKTAPRVFITNHSYHDTDGIINFDSNFGLYLKVAGILFSGLSAENKMPSSTAFSAP